MRNTEKKNMQRKLDELKRITGLSFSLDLPDTTDLPEAEAEETESYLLHQLDSLIASYKEVNSKEAIYKKWITGDLETTGCMFLSLIRAQSFSWNQKKP